MVTRKTTGKAAGLAELARGTLEPEHISQITKQRNIPSEDPISPSRGSIVVAFRLKVDVMESDRAAFLHSAARVLYRSSVGRELELLAREVESTKPDEIKSTPKLQSARFGCPPASCKRCASVWVPGVTCKTRCTTHPSHGLNKRARAKAKRKKDAYIEHSQQLVEGFTLTETWYLTYTCNHCHYKYRFPVKAALPSQESGPSNARKRAKIRKQNTLANVTSQTTDLKPKSFSLQDFLL